MVEGKWVEEGREWKEGWEVHLRRQTPVVLKWWALSSDQIAAVHSAAPHTGHFLQEYKFLTHTGHPTCPRAAAIANT